MKAIKIFRNLLIVIVLLTSATLLAQVKKDTSKNKHKTMKHSHQMMHDSSSQHHMHDMKMMKDSTYQMMNGEHKMTEGKKSPLIREGEIDLNAIDENKDGKVFQDQMDWNVISDKPGECPLCGMNLKEVTLQQAKENLLKHNFKVKNGVEQK
ncbi:MAG: heavy metal-binding domain-containing protein [Melioribacter sp.]|uniref:heavy metal-binding domain-containing protein n=1 Tax=Rosettibacter primus TaxID=3111523 RepID=UPI00247CD6C6|nr:heavy metal-binding domain-containing protein [Melioribacter sp.]